tara:strand:- start:207 stop:599 length:393 start_codon:yes stop_codon:yes gene_type:complete
MNILGTGIDLVDVKRINKLLHKNNKFLSRIFTNNEITYCDKSINSSNCYAKRFAAKESFIKALGGLIKHINFKDIEVKNSKSGKPSIYIKKFIQKEIQRVFKIKKYNIYLSLSDEKNYAVASVLITKNEN